MNSIYDKLIYSTYDYVFELNLKYYRLDRIDYKENIVMKKQVYKEYDTYNDLIDNIIHAEDRSVIADAIKRIHSNIISYYNEFYIEARVLVNEEYLWHTFVYKKFDDYVDKAIVFIKNIDKIIFKRKILNKILEKSLTETSIASQAKTEFLSRMSHDLRTPMNAIIGMTGIALDNIDDKEILKNSLLKIERASNVLLNIISDVIDMSKIERGQIVIEERQFSIIDNLYDICEIIEIKCKDKKQSFDVVIDRIDDNYVIGDEAKLQQILINLLSNAVKFTHCEGSISILLRQVKSDKEDYCCFNYIVSDSGIGMSSDFLKKIFVPFEREEMSMTSNIEGTGLGLAIVRNLINCIGGTIKVDSIPDVGTTIDVRVYLQKTEKIEKQIKNKLNDELDFSDKNLLIVEDKEINIEILKAMLQPTGINIEVAYNGREAVEILNENDTFDMVFMDIQMPIMNGYETTKYIRNEMKSEIKDVPIIFMSANVFREDVEKAREAGMTAYMAKPIKKDKLYDTMKMCFR